MLMLKNNALSFVDFGAQKNDLVVQIPSNLDKSQLLDALKEGLQFPAYFGNNWDALADVMRDLQWLPKRVAIVHNGMPALSEKDLKIYLEILQEAVSTLSKRGDHELAVIFSDMDTEGLRQYFNISR